MKKIIILLSLLALSFFTFSCGGGSGGSSSPSGENPGIPSSIQVLPSHYVGQTNSVITLHAKVLDGNGKGVGNVTVWFTNLSPIGVLSATSANTNDIGIATVTIKSTVEGFATIQAEVNKGVSNVRDKRTVFFATSLNLQPYIILDVDGDGDGIYNEASDLILFENATDNQVVIRATVFNRFGQRAAFTSVTFGADSLEASFPLGSIKTTDADGEAFVLVRVDPIEIRNIQTVLNITAVADNGAANMVSLFLQPVTVNSVSVSANPSVVAPNATSTILATVLLNTGTPAPAGSTVSFVTSCGTVTPFAQTTNGVATATFTAPSTPNTCTVTASIGGVSGTANVLVTTALTVQPSKQTINGINGGTATYTIFGGVAPYTITADNPLFLPVPATVNASGGTFAVTVPTNTAPETVTYTIRDSIGTIVTATLTIGKGADLSVQPSTVTVDGAAPADIITFTIFGGVPGYQVFSDNPLYPPVPASVSASGGTFTVSVPAGSVSASATYTVRDSLGTTATAKVTVTSGGGTGIPMSISPTSATVAGIQNPDSSTVDNLMFILSNVSGGGANCISSQPAVIASPGVLSTLGSVGFEIDPNAVAATTIVTITCTDVDGFIASALVTVTPPGLSISLNPIHVIGRANPPGGDGDITDDVLVTVVGGVGPYIVNIEPFSLTTIVPGGPWPSAVPWTFLVDPTNVITNTIVTFKVTDGIGTTASANLVVYTENTGLVANTSKENVIGLANPDGNTADDVTITVAGANNPFIVSWVCSCGFLGGICATPASPVVINATSGTVTFDPDRNTWSPPSPVACTVNVTDNFGSAATLNVTIWP